MFMLFFTTNIFCQLQFFKPTTGIEPVNLILTKDVLYLLSYMGIKKAGNETRTHNSHLGRVELYQLSYARVLYIWAGVGSNHRRR